MGNDAGFAAAVTIRREVLQSKLAATYANGHFPSTLHFPLPDGPPEASVAFFLGEPGIACEGAANLLVVTLPVWGKVTVTQTDAVVLQVKGLIEVTIVPDFRLVTISGSTKSAQLNRLTPIAVRTWTATVTSADPPPDVASYVTGDLFRLRLQTAIAQAVLLGGISLPQIPVDYLHGIPAFVAENGIASLAVDGALLLGFITGSDSPTGPLVGDVTALTDFAGSFDLAAFVNPQAALLFFNDVQDSLTSAAAGQGAKLDAGALRITLADQHAHVTGKLLATGATLNFSFDVIPHLANYSGPGASWSAYTAEHWVDNPRPRIVKPRSWPALWFTTGNAQADVDGSWWIDLIDVVTGGLSLLYFLPKFSNAEDSFETKVDNRPPKAPYSRVQRTVAPAGGIVLRTALDGFELDADGIFVGVHVSARPTSIAVIGPAILPGNYTDELLGYKLRLPSGALPSDPALRVAWTLTDATSGAVLISRDDQVTSPSPGFEFQPSAFASITGFAVEARLYRLFGANAADVGAAATSLQMRGPLTPGAYVTWRAQSVKPQVSFDTTTGQWIYGGDAHVQRRSKWHRTDAPCQSAARGANYAGRYQPDFADSLPFALDQLDQSRPLLCDYCFFGGPAGTNIRL